MLKYNGGNLKGKSNVMDALGFVMGERASSLRVKQTKDLIHGAHVSKPVSRTASVTMRFCDDNDEETVFSRTISGVFGSQWPLWIATSSIT